jgi:hypothetical protein
MSAERHPRLSPTANFSGKTRLHTELVAVKNEKLFMVRFLMGIHWLVPEGARSHHAPLPNNTFEYIKPNQNKPIPCAAVKAAPKDTQR